MKDGINDNPQDVSSQRLFASAVNHPTLIAVLSLLGVVSKIGLEREQDALLEAILGMVDYLCCTEVVLPHLAGLHVLKGESERGGEDPRLNS